MKLNHKTMKKQQLKTIINAPRVIVWEALWNDKNYRDWTSAFIAGSYAESDWKEGSEIKFLSPGGGGMYGLIDKKSEPEYMAFKHMGEIKAGEKLQPSSWAGAMETYRLNEKDGGTELMIELDMSDEDFNNYFATTWPKAIERLKQLAESEEIKSITIDADVNAPIHAVWAFWNDPQHVMVWNTASPDWHTPRAENDLRVGGKFMYRMEAKDGSFGFDFAGVYDVVKPNEQIACTMGDGRKVTTNFSGDNSQVKITVKFDAENMNSLEMQRMGWQSILNNFKKFAEEQA